VTLLKKSVSEKALDIFRIQDQIRKDILAFVTQDEAITNEKNEKPTLIT